MEESLQARLVELREEFEIGQRRAAELERQQGALRETMLRISGAIQVLEEIMAGSPPGPREPGLELAAPVPEAASLARNGTNRS